MRGSGEWWRDEAGFNFRRRLVREPILIPWQAITEIRLGRWHLGRWLLGYPVVKILWRKDRLLLSSGFFLTKSWEEAEALCTALERQRARYVGGSGFSKPGG